MQALREVPEMQVLLSRCVFLLLLCVCCSTQAMEKATCICCSINAEGEMARKETGRKRQIEIKEERRDIQKNGAIGPALK